MKQKVWQQKLLLLYFAVTVVLMGWSNYLADRYSNNSFIYHGYSLFEVMLIIPLIGLYNHNTRRWIVVAVVAFSIFWLVNILCWEHYSMFNSNSAGVAALLIVVFCLRYFLLLTKTQSILHFQKLPSFWVVFGFLFYCSTSVLILSSYKFLHNYLDLGIVEVWDIISILNIIKFTLIIIAGVCYYRQTSQVRLS